MDYLEDILTKQQLTHDQIQNLQNLRNEIQDVLTGNWNAPTPRFYYGGSYAKNTMIQESYDLDIVIYFSSDTNHSLKDIYEAVEARLKTKYITIRKNVAIRLPYERGLHVDIVPGRALDNSYLYANLYASDLNTSKQTSIKKHIDLVRKNGGYQNVIRLLKIWKLRNNLDLRTFPLEIITANALVGVNSNLDNKFWTVLEFLRDQFQTVWLEDPANSNNIVSDSISDFTKMSVTKAAWTSLSKKTWNEIIW